MRNNESYIPPELRDDAAVDEHRAYYLKLWPTLLKKWTKVGAAHVAFDEDNPLGQWRIRIETIYEIELPLPKKK